MNLPYTIMYLHRYNFKVMQTKRFVLIQVIRHQIHIPFLILMTNKPIYMKYKFSVNSNFRYELLNGD